MKIVIVLTDAEKRTLIVGPFEHAEDAREWAMERAERTEPLPDLLWEVQMISTPEEYDGTYGGSQRRNP